MAMVLSNVEDERCFFNVFYEEQIEKRVDNLFRSHGTDVYTKFLHYGDFPIYCNYQILRSTKELEGCICIVDTKITQKTPTTKP